MKKRREKIYFQPSKLYLGLCKYRIDCLYRSAADLRPERKYTTFTAFTFSRSVALCFLNCKQGKSFLLDLPFLLLSKTYQTLSRLTAAVRFCVVVMMAFAKNKYTKKTFTTKYYVDGRGNRGEIRTTF